MTNVTAAMVKELRKRTGAAMMACKKALQEAQGNMEAAIDVLRKAGEAKAVKRAGKIAAEGVIVLAVSADQKRAFMTEINSETDFVARSNHFVEFVDQVVQRGLEESAQNVETLIGLPFAAKGSESIDEVRKTLIAKIGENVQIRRVVLLESDGIVGHYCHGGRIGVIVALDRQEPALAKDIAMHIAASSPQSVSPEEVPSSLIDREREIFLEQAKGSGKPADIIEKMVKGRINKFLNEISLVGQPFFKEPTMTVGDLLTSKNARVVAFTRFEVGEGIEKETQNFADEVMSQVQGTKG